MNIISKIGAVRSISGTSHRGFTLIELMITLAIIGILMAIAYPSYKDSIIKSNRSSAQSHLVDIAQREQQYLLDSRSYAASMTDLNMTTPTDVSKYYTISIAVTAGPPPTFTATATPKAGTTQASDVTLTINNTGVKTPSDKW